MENTAIDTLVSGFRKVATELEELQVQLALGKADAKDKFEHLKKRFNSVLHDAQLKRDKIMDRVEDVHQKFDELRLQLALGKAESLELFEAQRKKISSKIQELEDYINSHPVLAATYQYLQSEFERVKLELEILASNFKIATLKSSDSIQKRRDEMASIIQKLQEDLEKKLHSAAPSGQDHFRNEIKQAYRHLKAAFE